MQATNFQMASSYSKTSSPPINHTIPPYMHEKNRIYTPENSQKYRRLSKIDATIWDQYLNIIKPKYSKLIYDLPITTQSLSEKVLTNNYTEAYLHLTNKRIDVLAFTDHYIDLFEIKDRANSHGLGQLLSYTFIYKLQFNPELPIHKILLCNYCTKIDKDCFEFFDISVLCLQDEISNVEHGLHAPRQP